tara:strand:- start:795 stop:1784 length:990 start_codon:yes stop_codon:yes gene_type:complete
MAKKEEENLEEENLEEENLEEISSMAGGNVEGYSLPLGAKKPKKKKGTIFRENEEEDLKQIVQEIVRNTIRKKIIFEHKQLNEEKDLRSVIRFLIKEAKKDVEAVPHSSTAINILEELLKQILPNLEKDFKTLTTSKEQRDSFRAHIVNAVSTLLDTEDVNKEGGGAGEEEALISLDEQEDEIEEEIELKISDVEASADEKFIDIEGGEPIPQEEEDTFGLEGQDATGRALSKDAFNDIEKNITETYAILHDEEDEKLFQDYLITNLKLYFDKWEKELGAVTEPTTDEYETEKAEGEAGDEAGAEFDAELGGELDGEASAGSTLGNELV